MKGVCGFWDSLHQDALGVVTFSAQDLWVMRFRLMWSRHPRFPRVSVDFSGCGFSKPWISPARRISTSESQG